MVKSNINKTIDYPETKRIEKEDYDLESSTYHISFQHLNENEYTVVFGNVNNSHFHKGIVYYPMYLVADGEVKSQIGVIEFETESLPAILDEDGDIDPNKIDRFVLYNFVNDAFLENFTDLNINDNSEDDKAVGDNEGEGEGDGVVDADSEILNEEDMNIVTLDDSVLDVAIKAPQQMAPLSSGDLQIFEINEKLHQPETLHEETKQDSMDLKEKYSPAPHHEWIQKFFKNKEYSLFDNEGSGDCLFAVIRDAYEQVGKITSVDKLREILANEVNDEIFNQNRNLYLDLENEIREKTNEIKKQNTILKEYKKRIKEDITLDIREEIIIKAKQAKNTVDTLKKKLKDDEEFMKDHSYMQKLDNIDKYRDYIRTASFWADAWAISVLELKLNMKFIILSESAFNDDSHDSVMQCGIGHEDIQKSGKFSPNYYIITSYSGDHYKLVSYKKKKIFSFREIPYDVKNLVINKCLELNSGMFHLIDDFRNLKKRLGLDSEIDDDKESDDEGIPYGLYENDVVFMIHSKSEKKAKPGKGAGEEIPKSKIPYYKTLGMKDNENWRRKIEDSFMVPFEMDKHKWGSVVHYYQGSKYKKEHPDYYLEFSMDSNSDISKDAELAKKKGALKTQDKKVSIDKDFYGERSVQENQNAIKAKFDQNDELKQLLIHTYPAKLTLFRRGRKAELAKDLMIIRKKYIDEK